MTLKCLDKIIYTLANGLEWLLCVCVVAFTVGLPTFLGLLGLYKNGFGLAGCLIVVVLQLVVLGIVYHVWRTN